MGVLYPERLGEWWAPQNICCYLCDEPVNLAEVNVYWHNPGRDILFHRECASKFGMHMIADSREALLASSHPTYKRRAEQVIASRRSYEKKSG